MKYFVAIIFNIFVSRITSQNLEGDKVQANYRKEKKENSNILATSCKSVSVDLYDSIHGTSKTLPASLQKFDSTVGIFTAGAYFNSHTTPNKLNRMFSKVGKNGDACQSGLGVYGIDNNGLPIATIKANEIDIMNHYIQFDFSKIDIQHNKISLTIGGSQIGEGYQLYGSNTAGTLGKLLYTSKWDPTGTCPEKFPYKFGKQYRYLSVTAADVGVLNGMPPNKFANVIVKSVTFSCGSESAPTASPSSIPSPKNVQATANTFNAIKCPADAPVINVTNAADYLTDVPGKLAIVEERFDIPCSQSSYIDGLCQKVLKKQYATDSLGIFEGYYLKLQPRFQAVTYRPKSLPTGVSKFPVIMMIHGNFEICGLKVKITVSDDGITKSYSWLDKNINVFNKDVNIFQP